MVGQSEASASCRSKTLKQGSTGSCVKVVQKYFGLKQDGIFGKNTKAKVVAFQQGFKLSADGIVGPKTWSKMCSVLKPGVSAHKSMAKSIGCTLTGNGSVYYK
ncbi:peptidoglycan-binding protein [Candidatus Saccharibacteria bacterium]|nr:peptidoglycan-binding protein [Candidatus Saccharibacteria bacterium]